MTVKETISIGVQTDIPQQTEKKLDIIPEVPPRGRNNTEMEPRYVSSKWNLLGYVSNFLKKKSDKNPGDTEV